MKVVFGISFGKFFKSTVKSGEQEKISGILASKRLDIDIVILKINIMWVRGNQCTHLKYKHSFVEESVIIKSCDGDLNHNKYVSPNYSTTDL